jgi:hypothetical protein
MKTKTEYAFFFAAGLMTGIIIEAYIFGANRRPSQVVSQTTSQPVASPAVQQPLVAADPASDLDESGTPELSIEDTTFDFGDRYTGEIVEHTFKLTNIGDANLHISQVLTSCGCTSSELSSNDVAPGESVDLNLKLDLHMQRGVQNRTIFVRSNDPKTSDLQLTLKGNALSHVELDPPYVVFGNPKDSQPQTATVSVIADDSIDSLSIKQTETSGKNLNAEVQTLEPGKKFAVKINVSSDESSRDFQGWVRLVTDQTGEYKSIAIPVSVTTQ